ncbi:MAG: hypothetical protein NDI90_13625 [Nitrospira sp. BO4]|jgi:hypothetical protein|nr:hypothetical protein [Nitrospira sp. BO4]
MPMMTRLFLRRVLLPAIALCSLMVPLNAAHAALVNYSFTGSIDGMSTMIVPVTGSFQFNSDTAGNSGAYNGAVTGFSLHFGGFNYTSSLAPGANAVTISQNIPMGGGSGNRWALASAVSGPNFMNSGYSPFNFDLRLDSKGGALFTSTDLEGPPSFSSLNGVYSLSGLTAARWRLFFEDSEGNPAVFLGSITSLTAVPLPAAVLLFGAGLVSLVGLGAGGLRNLRSSQA